MSIVIGKKEEGFTVVPTQFIQANFISLEARMTAIYLYSKPEGWRARPTDIQKNMGFGVRVWRKVSKELRQLNLLTESRNKSDTILELKSLWDKDFIAWLEEQSTGQQRDILSPCQNNTVLECADIQNIDKQIQNIDIKNNKKIIKKTAKEQIATKPKGKPQSMPQTEIEGYFAQMWELYPLKKAKQKALETFSKLFHGKTREESQKLLEAISRGFMAHLNEHNCKRQLEAQGADVWVPHLPHLTTWLNQCRWEDNYEAPEQLLAGVKKRKGIVDIDNVFGR